MDSIFVQRPLTEVTIGYHTKVPRTSAPPDGTRRLTRNGWPGRPRRAGPRQPGRRPEALRGASGGPRPSAPPPRAPASCSLPPPDPPAPASVGGVAVGPQRGRPSGPSGDGVGAARRSAPGHRRGMGPPGGRLGGLSVSHSKSIFVWRFCMGARGA
jgi:hypothetical protein